jgi:DNA processing protein
MNQDHYLLALNRIKQVGPRTVLKLITRWPNLHELFEYSITELIDLGVPLALAQAISNFDFKLLEEDLSWQAQSEEHHLITWNSVHYPPLLKEIADPPIVLYAKGNVSVLKNNNLAIVGSRNPSITGSENARHFAKELSQQGLTIVSGLALGIDAQAHIGCLEAGGTTIAVLGTGINCIYPRRHLKLAQQISHSGVIISEFPLNSPPIAGHFPQRNRIISGLSLSTLVVEAALKSGSLITARMALEQNRDVLAIPGSIHNPMARGCHYLLQQGATLVTSVVDVLNELRIAPSAPSVANNGSIPIAIKEENLVKFIGFEMTTVDQIVLRSGSTLEETTKILTQLELQGAVISVPGGYIRC